MKPFPVPHVRHKKRGKTSTDLSLALLDGLVHVGDVLAFHQGRIAHEGFLGTARERRSRPAPEGAGTDESTSRVTEVVLQAMRAELVALWEALERAYESAFIKERRSARISQIVGRVDRRKLIIGVVITSVIAASVWTYHRRTKHRPEPDHHQAGESQPGGQRNPD